MIGYVRPIIKKTTYRVKGRKRPVHNYKFYYEIVKTNNIDKFNKGEQIKFKEDVWGRFFQVLYGRKADTIYLYDDDKKMIVK